MASSTSDPNNLQEATRPSPRRFTGLVRGEDYRRPFHVFFGPHPCFLEPPFMLSLSTPFMFASTPSIISTHATRRLEPIMDLAAFE